MKARAGNKVIYLVIILLLLLAALCSINRLSLLKESADLIFVCYPAGSVAAPSLEQLKENDKGTGFSKIALWKAVEEAVVSAENTGCEQKVTFYQVKGQPDAVFANGLLQGRYFTDGENAVCLLGQSTARRLFGTENVLGLEVEAAQKTYQIIGILKGEQQIFAVPAGEYTGFDGVAVQKQEAGQSSNLAISLIEAVFGTTDGQKVDGQLYFMTAKLFFCVVSALMLIVAGIAAVRERKNSFKCLSVLCLAAAVWVMAAGLKSAAPGADYLPTYWSDFDFFVRLFQEKAGQIQRLAAYQEFPIWQNMLHAWRQVMGVEIFAGMILGIIFLQLPHKQ